MIFLSLSSARRLAACAAAAATWLAAGTPSAGFAPHGVHGPAGQASQPSAQFPAFRLGTAAGSFGSSTVVGDFNVDGTPDVAIADRVFRFAGTISYTIEFEISGREPRTVAFESTEEALTVGVSDIDHDNDLDLVVSAAFSREVVGVWLNDGRGGFEASDARRFASETRARHSLDAGEWPVHASVAALEPRHPGSGLTGSSHRVHDSAARSPVRRQATQFQTALLASIPAPRAPPS